MNLNYKSKDFVKTSNVDISPDFFDRIKTGDENIDEIFGGGILRGSTITLTAKGGVGKSVFCLTLGELLCNKGYRVGYSSGEESKEQIAFNAKRLNVSNLQIGNITDIDALLERMYDLDLLIIDSYQSLTTSKKLNNAAKKNLFIEELVKKAKDTKCAIIFIVQINSDGTMKGGTTLSHAVDMNIKLMKDPPKYGESYRIFDSYKNRFGSTGLYSAIMESSGYKFLGKHVVKEKSKNADLNLEKIGVDIFKIIVKGLFAKR